MSLNKAIIHGKEYRKPYTNSKAFDYSCRNHGGCDYCKGNRMYSINRELERTTQMLKECDLSDK